MQLLFLGCICSWLKDPSLLQLIPFILLAAISENYFRKTEAIHSIYMVFDLTGINLSDTGENQPLPTLLLWRKQLFSLGISSQS